VSEPEDDWFEAAAEDRDEDAATESTSDGETSGDDWFERATEDDEDGADAGDEPSPPSAEDEAPVGPPEPPDGKTGADADRPGEADGEELEFEDVEEDDGASGFDDLGSADDAGPRDGEGSREGPRDDDGDGLFEQDFASELGGANSSSPGGGSARGSNAGGGSPDFGMGGDEVDLTSGGEFSMSGGEEFDMGGGGFGMGGGEDFDDEEFESDIGRIDLGIEGLDEMIQGGVPRRSLMVAIGSAGTGKTTFGIQFLNEELRNDDGGNAVFITLEESHERIISSATEKGYPFDEYVDDGRLAIVDMDPIEMANSLATIRSELPRLISEFDAGRLVLDSVSLLEMMYDSRATRRNEIYDFTKSLKEAGVTTMMTSEASSSDPYTSRYGIVEYLTDAVFVLQYVRPSDFRKTRLAVEIQKIRDANHSRETKPYEITNSGISVYRQANIF
jgi:KaiC domain protein